MSKLVDRHMNEKFNFGGVMVTRAKIYELIHDRDLADAWLMGAEQAKKRAALLQKEEK